ncbi:bifunctional ADP-dependent NAD(P)H-hydrate dehydratase/NAD(P)H-hydrate epimerase [Thermobifida cellulosilytica]|uniref:Bifunctional NAD(P)H-hydrate repair enzyme n=1 Tax=Thermobifida cellulosilytica TB100 TaxID=665004 RepID=A0A147KKN1_THECS|nr:bifunctional ADP-dependent NAD(P)H-hydrate dehydratase/NAD(P)H-hydrate epimerase [Thermobifida cellulosilytica]KUP97880.1 carbohydrate kinase [Thermobifida cellulosilytica TB100]
MRTAHVVETVRTAEHALMARLPDGTLMHRAAFGLASVCAQILPRVSGARVVLLVGSGDNGGDALFAGAELARRGAAVTAVAAGRTPHPGGLAALRAAGGRTAAVAEAADLVAAADLVVDGLVGIGVRGALREPHASLAALTETTDAAVVAVDLPSGVDADTGAVPGASVRADVTVTFGTHKPGLLVDPGAQRAGVVEFVDIGLAPDLPAPDVVAPQAADVAALLPRPTAESDKYRRGVLGLAAGSDRYRGAAVLAAGGALRTGVGMLRYAGQPEVAREVVARWPEAVVSVLDPMDPVASLPRRVAAWVIGPGRGLHPTAAAELEAVLATEEPVLVDADAITLLARDPDLVRKRDAPTLLTPHAGELSRLLPGADRADIEANRLEHARRAAAEYGCTVLLKGSTTLVAEPGRPVAANPTGTPLLATAGSGDVLAGMIGALLAAGLPSWEAAVCGAYLHGLAARLAHDGAPISASDLFDAVPRAIAAVTRPGE